MKGCDIMANIGTIITILICTVLVVLLTSAVIKGIWSTAQTVTVPIQVVLFVVILVCVWRMFYTKENARKLYDGIEQTGIGQNMDRAMRSALNMKPSAEQETKTVSAPQENASVAKSAEKGEMASRAAKTETPTAINVAAETKNSSQAVAEPAPVSVPTPDYSHLNKGKKVFNYALPFNAKVTVGFKNATYRVIVDSLGQLSADDKKEVGKMIVSALGKYVGTGISGLDKSKISIEPRYDETDNHTRVYAVIPPDAIE